MKALHQKRWGKRRTVYVPKKFSFELSKKVRANEAVLACRGLLVGPSKHSRDTFWTPRGDTPSGTPVLGDTFQDTWARRARDPCSWSAGLQLCTYCQPTLWARKFQRNRRNCQRTTCREHACQKIRPSKDKSFAFVLLRFQT